jgi:protein subunit release factor A
MTVSIDINPADIEIANLFDPVVPGQMWIVETKESVPTNPTEFKSSVQKTRSQQDNRQRAMQMPSQLYEIELKKQSGAACWHRSGEDENWMGFQIRSNYVMQPYKLVKKM